MAETDEGARSHWFPFGQGTEKNPILQQQNITGTKPNGQYTCSTVVLNSLQLIIDRLFQITNLMHNSFIFQKHICYTTLLNNCITTASGIVTLCKQPYSMQVESGLQSALHPHTVRLLTEGDDTRGCGDTIGPPEDEQRAARNMLRSVV